jgi:uncharacterized protein (DUF433 family)
MPTAPEIIEAIEKLDPSERAEVESWIAAHPSDEPPIQQTPGVCGGSACIRKTRIMVWLLEGLRRLGMSEAEILSEYPSLTASDLVNAWAYVARHPDEIDEEIARNEEA